MSIISSIRSNPIVQWAQSVWWAQSVHIMSSTKAQVAHNAKDCKHDNLRWPECPEGAVSKVGKGNARVCVCVCDRPLKRTSREGIQQRGKKWLQQRASYQPDQSRTIGSWEVSSVAGGLQTHCPTCMDSVPSSLACHQTWPVPQF